MQGDYHIQKVSPHSKSWLITAGWQVINFRPTSNSEELRTAMEWHDGTCNDRISTMRTNRCFLHHRLLVMFWPGSQFPDQLLIELDEGLLDMGQATILAARWSAPVAALAGLSWLFPWKLSIPRTLSGLQCAYTENGLPLHVQAQKSTTRVEKIPNLLHHVFDIFISQKSKSLLFCFTGWLPWTKPWRRWDLEVKFSKCGSGDTNWHGLTTMDGTEAGQGGRQQHVKVGACQLGDQKKEFGRPSTQAC
jgi:hypothetical protein